MTYNSTFPIHTLNRLFNGGLRNTALWLDWPVLFKLLWEVNFVLLEALCIVFMVLMYISSMTWRIFKNSWLLWLELISSVAPGVCKSHQDATRHWPLFFALPREFPCGWLKVSKRKAIKWPNTIAWILGLGLIVEEEVDTNLEHRRTQMFETITQRQL